MTDSRNHATENKLKIGDNVLVKQDKVKKFSTPFVHTPLKITAKKGSMITARGPDRAVTRNSSHFKKITEECSRAYRKEIPVEFEIESSQVTSHTNEDILEVPINSKQKPSETPVLTQRSSSRVRQVPKYLNDYVVK